MGIVTGAGGGLGAAYALALAREGATVVGVDIDGAALERNVQRVRDQGGRCFAYTCDLCDEAAVAHLFEDCVRDHGRVDLLVNNAGGAVEGSTAFIEQVDLRQWDRTLDINLKTAFLCCRAAAPVMKRQRYGKIVNVSSRAARSTGWFSEVSPAYVCAKAAVIALTRCVAKELGPYGVTANCLVPSFTISGPRLQESWDRMSEQERRAMLAQTPLGRLPRPEEYASVVVFLCSDESSYMTGAVVDVNGGSLMI